jgi:hypothetical protein
MPTWLGVILSIVGGGIIGLVLVVFVLIDGVIESCLGGTRRNRPQRKGEDE